MKTIKYIVGILALAAISAMNVSAVVVSAPLDGGLLALLGAAGIAYFIARKRKN
jgi:hypothetical protein